MSDTFEAEIKKLARSMADKPLENTKSAETGGQSRDFKAVLDEFLEISRKAAGIYNGASKGRPIQVYELTPDFLEIFLGIPSRRGGLCIISPLKLTVFFDEDPDIITVIGKIRSDTSNKQSTYNKSLQLIKISFKHSPEGYIYKDNTGSILDPEDILALILRWLVSP